MNNEIIDVKRPFEIGKKGSNKYGLVICPNCGSKRWVQLNKMNRPNYTGHCAKCSRKLFNNIGYKREDHPRWKGGKLKTKEGYIYINLKEESPFYPMADHHGYIREHRLVMAKYLGRCLETWEVVHHKNGIKDDNRIENLELLPNQANHVQINTMKKKIKELEERISILEYENQLLLGKLEVKDDGTCG